MPDYCEKCGNKLDENDKFCPDCGSIIKSSPQTAKKSNKNIIIALLVVIILLLVGLAVTMLATSVQNSQPEFETYDFGVLTMSVPADSNFNEYESIGKGTSKWASGYTNGGEGKYRLLMVWISTYEATSQGYTHIETDGDLEIYNGITNNYIVERYVDGYYVELTGRDNLDDLKQMARSIEVK
ncbi:MAG: zinc ribbon domain-containing protein [Methanobrevibacter sp.]